MKKFMHTALLAAALTWPGIALSLDLDSAKTGGLVGEQPNGYLGAIGSASAEVKALVSDINAKRKAAYADIAQRNGTPIDAVEQLAGKKAIEKTAPGQYVKLPSGEWTQIK